MLVLSRRKGERVVIPGCGVAITILDVKGTSIRLGIAAPRDVDILRGELVAEGTTVGLEGSAPNTSGE